MVIRGLVNSWFIFGVSNSRKITTNVLSILYGLALHLHKDHR